MTKAALAAKEGNQETSQKLPNLTPIDVENIDSVEAAVEAFNKKLGEFQEYVTKTVSTETDSVRKQIGQEKQQSLRSRAEKFAKDHPIFDKALKGEDQEFLDTMNALFTQNQNIEESYEKAMKALGREEEKKVVKPTSKSIPPPGGNRPPNVTTTESVDKNALDLKTKHESVADAARQNLEAYKAKHGDVGITPVEDDRM